jgi:hypothetical protein
MTDTDITFPDALEDRTSRKVVNFEVGDYIDHHDTPEEAWEAMRRDALVHALRQCADLLEEDPSFPRFHFSPGVMATSPEEFEQLSKGIGGDRTKKASPAGHFATIKRTICTVGGYDTHCIEAFIERDRVCEKVVVGTDVQEVEVPDYDSLMAIAGIDEIPTKLETVETDIVEWDCGTFGGKA